MSLPLSAHRCFVVPRLAGRRPRLGGFTLALIVAGPRRQPLGSRNFPQPPSLPAVHDETRTAFTPAPARVLPPFLKRKAVVKRQLVAGRNIPARDDPDAPPEVVRPAIRAACMVDQPRHIPARATVEVMPPVEFEDIYAVVTAPPPAFQPQLLAPLRLRLGDPLPGVFDDARAAGNQGRRIDPAPMDARFTMADPT